MTNRQQAIRVVTALENVAAQVVSALSVNITAELITVTPVDTGWARANWVPNIGNPAVGPGTAQADGAAIAAQAGRQSAGIANVLANYSLDRGAVFISNNVPYISRLNNGHSRQAPTGFVQQSIARAVSSLANRQFRAR